MTKVRWVRIFEEHQPIQPNRHFSADGQTAREFEEAYADPAGDVTGAFGAWQASPLPDWKVAVQLIEAGLDPAQVRSVLTESVARHEEYERRSGASAHATSDQIRRLIAWIDAGCPRTTSPSP